MVFFTEIINRLLWELATICKDKEQTPKHHDKIAIQIRNIHIRHELFLNVGIKYRRLIDL